MKNNVRPTLDEITESLINQPELCYCHPWADIVAIAMIAVVITAVGYTVVWGGKNSTDRYFFRQFPSEFLSQSHSLHSRKRLTDYMKPKFFNLISDNYQP